MKCVVLILVLGVTLTGAKESYDEGSGTKYEEYHYNLPVKETHTHLPSSFLEQKSPGKQFSDREKSYGRTVAAAAAAQHAHAHSHYPYEHEHGHAHVPSHYTKPGSGVKALSQKYSPAQVQQHTPVAHDYIPVPLTQSVKSVAGDGIKKPLGLGDVESAAGYLHGNYAGYGHGGGMYGGGYGLGSGYGYSSGYGPAVGYSGYGHIGYTAIPLGGYGYGISAYPELGHGYGGRGLGFGYGRGYYGGYGAPFGAGLGAYGGNGLGAYGGNGLGAHGFGGGYGLGGVGYGLGAGGLGYGGYGGYHG